MAKTFENCKKIHNILLSMKKVEIDDEELYRVIQNTILIGEATARRYIRDLIRFGFLEWVDRFTFRVNEERKKII
jgi:predicted transcriptional regulator